MEAEERIKDYAAKWFDRGREYGKTPITKGMLAELEEEGEKLLGVLTELNRCPNCGYYLENEED